MTYKLWYILIADIGCGTSNFIDNLLEKGFSNFLALDISNSALEIKKKLLEEKGLHSKKVTWISGDITDVTVFDKAFQGKIKLWYDRAVLHFLKTEGERQKYKENLLKNADKGAFVILAEFSRNGAKKCSGLDLLNYDISDIGEFLGTDFKLLESFSHTYIQPSGSPRPFTYSLFQREA